MYSVVCIVYVLLINYFYISFKYDINIQQVGSQVDKALPPESNKCWGQPRLKKERKKPRTNQSNPVLYCPVYIPEKRKKGKKEKEIGYITKKMPNEQSPP